MRSALIAVCVSAAVLALAGCEVSQPYVMKVPRSDQDVAKGNKGYLKGAPPPSRDRSGLMRPYLAVDIDVPDMPVNQGAKKACVNVPGESQALSASSAPTGEKNIK